MRTVVRKNALNRRKAFDFNETKMRKILRKNTRNLGIPFEINKTKVRRILRTQVGTFGVARSSRMKNTERYDFAILSVREFRAGFLSFAQKYVLMAMVSLRADFQLGSRASLRAFRE
jgi:hypothetical protein